MRDFCGGWRMAYAGCAARPVHPQATATDCIAVWNSNRRYVLGPIYPDSINVYKRYVRLRVAISLSIVRNGLPGFGSPPGVVRPFRKVRRRLRRDFVANRAYVSALPAPSRARARRCCAHTVRGSRSVWGWAAASTIVRSTLRRRQAPAPAPAPARGEAAFDPHVRRPLPLLRTPPRAAAPAQGVGGSARRRRSS
jgi:hypothetical protein